MNVECLKLWVQDLSLTKQTINKHEELHTGVTKWYRYLNFHSYKILKLLKFIFHCFTVHFVSLSFIYTNVCTCF